MKIDKSTYKDRKEIQLGKTVDYPSKPDKVLFFADPIFCFLGAAPHCTHYQIQQVNIQSNLPKSAILPTLPNRII